MMEFQIIIDDLFSNIYSEDDLEPINNKKVLSLINDFENGSWRYSKFQEFIFNNIAETALSLNERKSLFGNPYSVIKNSAKNLRLTDSDKDPGKGSELAEILLYGIMNKHYKALPVVPKIFYKQNTQDYAKGADSIHIVIENQNDFSIWFGEAKFYESIEDSHLSPIIQSIENSLNIDKLKKENSIITNVKDLEDLEITVDLLSKIKKLLSNQETIDIFKPKLNIPILLLHECKITERQQLLTDNYKTDIKNYHLERAKSYFGKQIDRLKNIHLYSEIKFHLILFPTPCKKTIVDNFIENVEQLRKQ